MLIQKGGAVYIISNVMNTVFYTGVTSNLMHRIWQHKNKIYPDSFSAKYNCNILLWFEVLPTIDEAIARQKQIKGGSRKRKIELIKNMNPQWKDLWEEVQFW